MRDVQGFFGQILRLNFLIKVMIHRLFALKQFTENAASLFMYNLCKFMLQDVFVN